MSIENEIADALQHNDDARACSLIESAKNLNLTFCVNGDSLLFISASQSQTPKSTRKLLEKGASANSLNWHLMPPVIVCADKGHNLETLKALIDYNADLDYCMRSNQNAWFFASLSGWTEGRDFLGNAMRRALKEKISTRKKLAASQDISRARA